MVPLNCSNIGIFFDLLVLTFSVLITRKPQNNDKHFKRGGHLKSDMKYKLEVGNNFVIFLVNIKKWEGFDVSTLYFSSYSITDG